MPYTPSAHSPTPESLLPRTDSKNPATTCKGITSSGRPCRRQLASPTSSPRSRRASAPVVTTDDPGQNHTKQYCWQHKDQATEQGAQSHSNETTNAPKRRTSTDTLVARFSELDISNGDSNGQLLRQTRPHARPQRRRKPSFWTSLCCVSEVESDSDKDDYVEIVRHKRRTQPSLPIQASQPEMQSMGSAAYLTSAAATTRPRPHRMPASAPAAPVTSPTQKLMRYMPPTLDAKTTSNLLAEFSKPISHGDEEGYIYIFWLTPESRAAWKPSDDDAESLLQPSPRDGTKTSRSTASQNELLRAHSVVRRPRKNSNRSDMTQEVEKRSILLKIGRASNVHRRMSEWTRQCGYDLSLVRFYPYVSSAQLKQASPTPSPRASPGAVRYPSLPQSTLSPPSVRKVPYSHRVERLVHIELAAMRSKDQGKCGACGRDHREWFEVEATREGVKAVDGVVKRWVGWAEDTARTSNVR